MHLLRRLVVMAYFLEVGLLLTIAPWTPFLQRNYFVEQWPWIKPIVANACVRGGLTGLGLINLWAGLAEVVALLADRGRQTPAPDDPVSRNDDVLR